MVKKGKNIITSPNWVKLNCKSGNFENLEFRYKNESFWIWVYDSTEKASWINRTKTILTNIVKGGPKNGASIFLIFFKQPLKIINKKYTILIMIFDWIVPLQLVDSLGFSENKTPNIDIYCLCRA